MRKTFLIVLFCTLTNLVFAQHKTENIIIVTLDGMRWQEVFKGADSGILNNKNFTHDNSTKDFFGIRTVLKEEKNCSRFYGIQLPLKVNYTATEHMITLLIMLILINSPIPVIMNY